MDSDFRFDHVYVHTYSLHVLNQSWSSQVNKDFKGQLPFSSSSLALSMVDKNKPKQPKGPMRMASKS